MLTIKHIEVAGHETVMEARRVTSQPVLEADRRCGSNNPDEPATIDYGKRTIFVEREDGSVENFSTGTIYVMNSKGETVSRHFMGEDGRGNVEPKAA